jgi:hypothetical protein
MVEGYRGPILSPLSCEIKGAYFLLEKGFGTDQKNGVSG